MLNDKRQDWLKLDTLRLSWEMQLIPIKDNEPIFAFTIKSGHKFIYIYRFCETLFTHTDYVLIEEWTQGGLRNWVIHMKPPAVRLHSINELSGFNQFECFVCCGIVKYISWLGINTIESSERKVITIILAASDANIEWEFAIFLVVHVYYWGISRESVRCKAGLFFHCRYRRSGRRAAVELPSIGGLQIRNCNNSNTETCIFPRITFDAQNNIVFAALSFLSSSSS